MTRKDDPDENKRLTCSADPNFRREGEKISAEMSETRWSKKRDAQRRLKHEAKRSVSKRDEAGLESKQLTSSVLRQEQREPNSGGSRHDLGVLGYRDLGEHLDLGVSRAETALEAEERRTSQFLLQASSNSSRDTLAARMVVSAQRRGGKEER